MQNMREKRKERGSIWQEKYDSEVAKLKDLHMKRDEAKKKELIKAIENSKKSYDEIMAFITSGDE